MRPNLLTPACLLLAAALTAGTGAAILSLPPPPSPLDRDIPSDASDAGVGDATVLQDDDCAKTENLYLRLYNYTATRGHWAMSFRHQTSLETVPLPCASVGGTYLTTKNETFSPQEGGCFYDYYRVTHLCLEPFAFDERTGLHAYKVSFLIHEKSFHGHAKVRYLELPE